MPIITNKTLTVKILPVTINEDFSARVTLRKGVVEGDSFVAMSFQEVQIPPADLLQILSATPAAGKNRYQDLSDSLYEYLVAKGVVEGEIV